MACTLEYPRLSNLSVYTFTCMFRDVAILPACMCRILYKLFNLDRVLYRSPPSLPLDGEVRRHASIMSSHAPGEGGKNTPVQITEGPSTVSTIRRCPLHTKSRRHNRSDLDSCISRPPPIPTRQLLLNTRYCI